MNILQYTNSRNLCIFSCIFSRATTVDSFTTLSILTQIPSTQKFEKTRPKSFKVLLTMLSQSVQRVQKPLPRFFSQYYFAKNQLHLIDSQIPTEPKADAEPACLLFPRAEPLAQRTKQLLKFQLLSNFSTLNCEESPFSVFSIIVGKAQTEFSCFVAKG